MIFLRHFFSCRCADRARTWSALPSDCQHRIRYPPRQSDHEHSRTARPTSIADSSVSRICDHRRRISVSTSSPAFIGESERSCAPDIQDAHPFSVGGGGGGGGGGAAAAIAVAAVVAKFSGFPAPSCWYLCARPFGSPPLARVGERTRRG